MEPLYFLKLYKQICSLEGSRPVNGSAYSVATFNFNLAYEIKKDKRVRDFTHTYLSLRTTQIKKLVATSDVDKAEELALKTYAQCSQVEGVPDFKSEMETLFGRDIFLNVDPEDN